MDRKMFVKIKRVPETAFKICDEFELQDKTSSYFTKEFSKIFSSLPGWDPYAQRNAVALILYSDMNTANRSGASAQAVKQEVVEISETIKMVLESNFTSNGTTNNVPKVKFDVSKADEKKLVKVELQISSGYTAFNFRLDFAQMQSNFANLGLVNNLAPTLANNGSVNYNSVFPNGNIEMKVKVTIKSPIVRYFEIPRQRPLAEGIFKDFHSLLNNKKLSDFRFKVDGKVFYVNKAILAARSPVFMTMFLGDFQENKNNEGTVADISHEAFLDFLRYIYTETVSKIEAHVLELLAISHLYDVKGLKVLCENQLLAGLTEENSPDVFQYSHLYHCGRILKLAAFVLVKESFAKNNFTIPDNLVDAPAQVQALVATKKQMALLLRSSKSTED